MVIGVADWATMSWNGWWVLHEMWRRLSNAMFFKWNSCDSVYFSGNMRFFFFLSFLFIHVQLKLGYDLLWNIDGIVTDHLCLQINMHYHRSSVLLLGMILEWNLLYPCNENRKLKVETCAGARGRGRQVPRFCTTPNTFTNYTSSFFRLIWKS